MVAFAPTKFDRTTVKKISWLTVSRSVRPVRTGEDVVVMMNANAQTGRRENESTPKTVVVGGNGCDKRNDH